MLGSEHRAALVAGRGARVLLIVARVGNNLAPRRRYPEFW
jgi:hypothetical protein